MNITERESELFNKWKNNRIGFVSDGVVSEQDYLNSKIKLCFVLKEVNDVHGGGWDLREFIRTGSRAQTWNNVTRWVQSINNGNADIPWIDLESVSEKQRVDTLRTICAMNLKKSPGTHTTVRANFDAVVAEDKKFINEQYDIYNADLTICCGTGWDLRFALDLNDEQVYETSRGIKWFVNHQNKPVVMYAHPAARVQDSLLLYGLIDAVREIKHNKRLWC
ncbi:hypothetical protein F9817_22040 [Vibrio sp. CAIM 722]|uniref:Uncharacterized protein n=1 Tax=Vibrio eleionomae TaxID=2653505 RepID=A0A7X4LQ80_9VIBR|nr:hypothetical protein [Vibrio eleionomae]MZI95870.1 hypothetical protein [Vibrio eleionomae]